MTGPSKTWAFRMAWRDSRSSRNRLLLFVSSIVLGVASLVAISSFEEQSQRAVSEQAQSLLGADLSVTVREPIREPIAAIFDSLGGDRSRMIRFASMVSFLESGNTRLAEVRALDTGFPFSGEIESDPPESADSFRQQNGALIEKWLAIQYAATVGDSIRIGTFDYPIVGLLESIPGDIAVGGLISPRVLIPYNHVDTETLLGPGSLASFTEFFDFDSDAAIRSATTRLDSYRNKYRFSYDTVEERQDNWSAATGNLYAFLSLVGFIALILGGVGVASTIHVYIRQKISTVALLRCLGASSSETVKVFAIQAVVLGFLGSVIGVLMGYVLQGVLPLVLGDFLPVEVQFGVSPRAALLGLVTGTGVTLLFALIPLLDLRGVSPLRTIRSGVDSTEVPRSIRTRILIGSLISIAVTAFAVLQTKSLTVGFFFAVGVGAALGILALASSALIWTVRRVFPTGWSFTWRQGLASLFRPNNQTLVLVLAIGLGTFLLSTLYLSRSTLLDQVAFSGGGDRPNTILFDIQSDQIDGVVGQMAALNLPVLQQVPIVTTRLESVNGKTPEQLLADTTDSNSRFALQREYRVTYRDSLTETESVLDGVFGQEKEGGPVQISLEAGIADQLDVGVGDPITWNVQGVSIDSEVGSIREVDWQRVQPNFFAVFPSGVLEEAPQFHVAVTRVPSDSVSATLQRTVVAAYPNVSIIDLSLILDTVDNYLGKISFVIQFMALFSILTGLIVLAGAVLSSRFQRIKESVLLRTLGATRSRVLKIMVVEYLLLGSLASLIGLLLSIIAGALLAYFVFDAPFNPFQPMVFLFAIAVVAITILIGLSGSRGVHSRSPLEILRAEG